MQNSENSQIAMYNNSDLSSLALQNFEIHNDWGIDKIGFYLPTNEFAMPKDLLKGFEEQSKTRWDTIDRNKQITAKKYFRNTTDYNITISDEGLSCHYNPSKLIHPFRLNHNPEIIIEQLGDIQRDLLKKSNFEINIENATAFRIDLAKNIYLKHPYDNYTDVVNTFQGKRHIKKTHDDSFYWRNNSNEFTLYNKYKELQEQKEQNITYLTDNFMRGEVRMKKTECVNGIFKTKNLLEIVSKGSELRNYYNDFVNDRILRKNQYSQLKIEFGDIDIMMIKLSKQYKPQRAFNELLKIFGVQFSMEMPGMYEILIKVIEKHSTTRQTIHNRTKELNRLINQVKHLKENRKEIQFINLNNELRNKLLIA